ncbi:MAG: hypothetical protein IJX91_01355 [Clostridia bacterium]|nr:hypothetical protein [Clostridia bacterium]
MSIKSSIKRFNRRPLWKRILATVLGLVTIGGAVFGVTKLVEHVNDDLKTIHPSFEVGTLGTDGKYVEDEGMLYTEESFKCDGLQVKLDFDNKIDYQIFYYDDVGNFVKSTDLLTEGYSDVAYGTYARIVIKPNADEDDKIDWKEKISYPAQMEVKVKKEQKQKSYVFSGQSVMTVDNVSNMRFVRGSWKVLDGVVQLTSFEDSGGTTFHLLKVSNKTIKLNKASENGGNVGQLEVFEFDKNMNYLGQQAVRDDGAEYASAELKDATRYVLFNYALRVEGTTSNEFMRVSDSVLQNVQNLIVIE